MIVGDRIGIIRGSIKIVNIDVNRVAGRPCNYELDDNSVHGYLHKAAWLRTCSALSRHANSF